jgi:RNA polymerase sigma factor (sigma-70 family)
LMNSGFLAHANEEKLNQLARQNVDFVYAAAARQMSGDANGAQDVTQTVMLVMMKKARAGNLPEERFMAGWLLQVTAYAVLQAKRAAARRSRHEKNARASSEKCDKTMPPQDELRAVLDEAILALRPVDQEVVVRRHLREESLAAIATAMGMNENTAGKRVARATEKLRKILMRRGITSPVVVFAAVMGVEANVKAPASCAAINGGKQAILGWANNVIWRLTLAKVKTILVGSALMALLGGGVTAVVVTAADRLISDEANGGQLIRTLAGHTGAVTSVAISPDGKNALSGSDDNTLKLWNLKSGTELRTFIGHTRAVTSVAFSPDRKTALSGSADRTLKLWDLANGQAIRTLTGHTEGVNAVAFSPDGRTALSGSDDKTLKAWDISTGQCFQTFAGHSDGVWTVAFSPDGKTILSGSRDTTVKFWDLATGHEVRTLAGHSDCVTALAVSPDGKTALSGSRDKTLRLLDLASGRKILTFNGRVGGVWGVAFSSDGRTALTGSGDDTLRLWSVADGNEMAAYSGHTASVNAVAFSPDGKTVLSGSDDKTLKLWNLGTPSK